MLVDLSEKSISGKEAASVLDKAGITVNKNLIPHDKKPPSITSGIRLGTPAVTTRGMKEPEMEIIADLIDEVVCNIKSDKKILEVKNKVDNLTKKFKIYKDLISQMESQ